MTHTFAVCAYQKSRFLEECIQSLEAQTMPGNIIICTATPNEYISNIANLHKIPIYVNKGTHSIGTDWNYAYDQAKTDLVTLAHQDDIYEPTFLANTLQAIEESNHPLICFTDYYELRAGKKIYSCDSQLLRAKELMLAPLRYHFSQSNIWIRRRVLSLGNAICCPSVTFVKKNLNSSPFSEGFRSNLDWDTWETLSRQYGSFVYLHKPLMGHRIHEESTTSKVIGEKFGRSGEDFEMFTRFWPRPIAGLLNILYARSQNSNHLL